MTNTPTVDVSNRSRHRDGKFATEAPRPQGDSDLNAYAGFDDSTAEEARRVFASAEERRVQATGHSIRAGVNLLAVFAQSLYPDSAAELRFRYDDEEDTLSGVAINDADGHGLWAGPPSAHPALDEAARQVTSIPVTRDELAAADITVTDAGEGIVPLTREYDLDAFARLIG